jgi:hypothetical protein
MPSDGKSSHCLWQGELKKVLQDGRWRTPCDDHMRDKTTLINKSHWSRMLQCIQYLEENCIKFSSRYSIQFSPSYVKL